MPRNLDQVLPGRLLAGAMIGLVAGTILELNVHPAIIGLLVGIAVTLIAGGVPGPLEGAVVGIIIGSFEYILLVSQEMITNPIVGEKLALLSGAILIGSLVGGGAGGLIGLVFLWVNKGKK